MIIDLKCIGRRIVAMAALTTTLGMQMSIAYANVAMLPADIPFKSSAASDDNLVFRAILAFFIAGAVAFGLAWCIKRYLPKFGKKIGRDTQLERLESMRLSARSMLVRVRWGNEELLVGESEHGVTLIGKRPLQAMNEALETEAVPAKEVHE